MMDRHLNMPVRQQTLAGAFTYVGRGLHRGQAVKMRLLPAQPDSGIQFVRTDVASDKHVVKAHWQNVSSTKLCTGLVNAHGVSVHTVEHVLAALRGCNVDNALIELDQAEVPILDGSAEPFVSLIRHIGLTAQAVPRRAIVIKRPVAVVDAEKFALLLPHPLPRITAEIDFTAPAIGNQRLSVLLDADTFCRDIAPARTFGFAGEIEHLRAQGLALGGSLRNAILVDGSHVMNHEGLRFHNEFVRHKILDYVGDLSLLGAPVIGHLYAYKCGHALIHQLLHELSRNADASTRITLGEDRIPSDADPASVQVTTGAQRS